MGTRPNNNQERLNEKFIDLLDELASFMIKRGEQFRARAYQKAQEVIVLHSDDITSDNYVNLQKSAGIGETIMKKFKEFIETGTLKVLERERANPQNIFAEIYGIGPKKAAELVEKGIKTIADLREKQSEVLNPIQRVGLKYYEDILERIPRAEIDEYDEVFKHVLEGTGLKYEIVGSYRRGAKTSGDIDVILTSRSEKSFRDFVDRLLEHGIILEILSRGSSKCLVIAKLPDAKHARRVDFLYSTPEEYPFSVLYFTGSKIFNTVMRARALSMGYSMNEHGITKRGTKEKILDIFPDERSIFTFLGMEYKNPEERVDGRSVITKMESPVIDINIVPTIPPIITKGVTPKNKTVKKRLTKEESEIEKAKKEEEKTLLKMEQLKIKEAKQFAEKEAKEAKKLALKTAKEAQKETRRIQKQEKSTKKNKTVKQRPKEPTPKELISTPKESTLKEPTPKESSPKEPTTKESSTKKNKIKDSSKTIKIRRPKMKEVPIPSIPSTSCPPIDLNSTDPILHSLQHFKVQGFPILDTLSEETLNQMLLAANTTYYNTTDTGFQILTDNEYDILKEFIQNKYPKNIVVQEIGAPVVEKNKVTLPYQMPSMDKIKPNTGALQSWKLKYKGPYTISCKLDGVSGMYSTEGPVPKLYTRGNGTVGQDISHLIPYLRLPSFNIDNTINQKIVIRGEFVISKQTFREKYADTFANARNLVAGTINRLTVNDTIRDIDFVTYEVIEPMVKPSTQMAKLQEWGFNTVQNRNLEREQLSNNHLSEILVDWRKNYIYEIDGIIVSNDSVYRRGSKNPEHAFAFKMVLSDQMTEAKVLDVIWTASKDGYLKPRVQIEPVQLSGVKIEYATGFNAAFIETNKIGMGAIIQIIRSGDVIPHIKSVIVPAEHAKMPTVPYIWNSTHVDILLEDASMDATVREKNITGFFRGIEVDGLSSGNVARIVTAGYDTVPKILAMSKTDLLTIEGFKEKMADKIYNGIREKTESASLEQLMAASNIFGRGFSDKRIGLILEECPDILVSTEDISTKMKRVKGIKGMAAKTAEAFVEKIPDFLGFMEECKLLDKVSNKSNKNEMVETSDKTHPLYKKSIVMSGTRDKELEKAIVDVGGILGSSVSKNTFAVITPDIDAKTGKVATARELGVPIYTAEQFRSLLLK